MTSNFNPATNQIKVFDVVESFNTLSLNQGMKVLLCSIKAHFFGFLGLFVFTVAFWAYTKGITSFVLFNTYKCAYKTSNRDLFTTCTPRKHLLVECLWCHELAEEHQLDFLMTCTLNKIQYFLQLCTFQTLKLMDDNDFSHTLSKFSYIAQ